MQEKSSRLARDEVCAVQLDPTLDELAALSRAYHRASVVIDQYAAEPIRPRI